VTLASVTFTGAGSDTQNTQTTAMVTPAVATEVAVYHKISDPAGTLGARVQNPVYGPWYRMRGYVSGTTVEWDTRDPTSTIDYTGPIIPSPYFVVYQYKSK
jgi:hypothetical protein